MFFHIFFCSHKIYKIENYFIFEVLKKKIWPSFQIIRELFTQKFVTNLSKIWVGTRDPEKNPLRIPWSKRHRIQDPQHCLQPIVTTILECVTLLCRRPKIIA